MTLDLSSLPASPIVVVDYDATLADRIAVLADRWAKKRETYPSLPAFETFIFEGDPSAVLNEAFSADEVVVYQAINDAAKQLRLAQATGSNLDHLAGTYHRTERQIIVEETDDTDAVYEGDDAYRQRAQLAPEALADMGLTSGGYVFKVRTGFANLIKHVFPINRGDGRVELRVLGREGNGAVADATIAKIVSAFTLEEGQQSTDVLTVLSADIEEVDWHVILYIDKGPDAEALKVLAKTKLQALANNLHRINTTQYREAITTAAHVAPVVMVSVVSPAIDKIKAVEKAYYVRSITVEAEVL